ncbi:nucleotidyltransferase family protein [Fusibacter ferrireducens]|uniref:Nucleotidyltransferase family protein n=1 Tax=Fusibacter ferrireducens TaxID=2785058 RepID=A0ABR9ZUA9_9FIRM|nr:nucleotidyltransferase family protein [Fusibacter ferrireducens]MBF4693541.1 nucleotidyltransferase family protein [Fusibacter ferrireducens]
MKKTHISGVVLAAGASTRMQKNKILLPLNGCTVIETIVKTMLKTTLSEVIVIGGRDYDALSELMASYPVKCIENKAYLVGQSTSMIKGLSEMATGAEGCFFFMGDQPLIDVEHIDQMIHSFEQSGSPKTIVTPVGHEGRGAPVLFGAAWFNALREVKGDQGGRSVIFKAKSHVISHFIERSSFFWDIDDEMMYQRVLNEMDQKK